MQNARIEPKEAKEQGTEKLLNTEGAYNQMNLEECDCDWFLWI